LGGRGLGGEAFERPGRAAGPSRPELTFRLPPGVAHGSILRLPLDEIGLPDQVLTVRVLIE
jgi:hypothetical protein